MVMDYTDLFQLVLELKRYHVIINIVYITLVLCLTVLYRFDIA